MEKSEMEKRIIFLEDVISRAKRTLARAKFHIEPNDVEKEKVRFTELEKLTKILQEEKPLNGWVCLNCKSNNVARQLNHGK